MRKILIIAISAGFIIGCSGSAPTSSEPQEIQEQVTKEEMDPRPSFSNEDEE